MPWLTNDELKDALADLMREAGGGSSLPAAWDSVIDAARIDAQSDITSALGAMGFNTAQINRWQRLATYHRSLALFRMLTDGGILIDFDQERIDRLDRRKELSKKADPPFQFTNTNGEIEAPAASFTGDPVGGRGVASGRILPIDSRITDQTEW